MENKQVIARGEGVADEKNTWGILSGMISFIIFN